jgi:hypothetical protein
MKNVFEYITEIIGWLQIVASPLLIGLGIGAFIYFSDQTLLRLIIAIIISTIGLVIGIIWANKIWKTKGTVWFMSQVSATPDLDNLNINQEEKNKTDKA